MTINIYAAKTRLSELVEQAAKGKEVIIARAGRPVARLVPLKKPDRKLGTLKGKFTVPEDFDAPLPKSVARFFEGK